MKPAWAFNQLQRCFKNKIRAAIGYSTFESVIGPIKTGGVGVN